MKSRFTFRLLLCAVFALAAIATTVQAAGVTFDFTDPNTGIRYFDTATIAAAGNPSIYLASCYESESYTTTSKKGSLYISNEYELELVKNLITSNGLQDTWFYYDVGFMEKLTLRTNSGDDATVDASNPLKYGFESFRWGDNEDYNGIWINQTLHDSMWAAGYPTRSSNLYGIHIRVNSVTGKVEMKNDFNNDGVGSNVAPTICKNLPDTIPTIDVTSPDTGSRYFTLGTSYITQTDAEAACAAAVTGAHLFSVTPSALADASYVQYFLPKTYQYYYGARWASPESPTDPEYSWTTGAAWTPNRYLFAADFNTDKGHQYVGYDYTDPNDSGAGYSPFSVVTDNAKMVVFGNGDAFIYMERTSVGSPYGFYMYPLCSIDSTTPPPSSVPVAFDYTDPNTGIRYFDTPGTNEQMQYAAYCYEASSLDKIGPFISRKGSLFISNEYELNLVTNLIKNNGRQDTWFVYDVEYSQRLNLRTNGGNDNTNDPTNPLKRGFVSTRWGEVEDIQLIRVNQTLHESLWADGFPTIDGLPGLYFRVNSTTGKFEIKNAWSWDVLGTENAPTICKNMPATIPTIDITSPNTGSRYFTLGTPFLKQADAESACVSAASGAHLFAVTPSALADAQLVQTQLPKSYQYFYGTNWISLTEPKFSWTTGATWTPNNYLFSPDFNTPKGYQNVAYDLITLGNPSFGYGYMSIVTEDAGTVVFGNGDSFIYMNRMAQSAVPSLQYFRAYALCSIDSNTPSVCPWYDDCGVCQGDNSTCTEQPTSPVVSNPPVSSHTEHTSLQVLAIPYEAMTTAQKLSGVPYVRFVASATYDANIERVSIRFNCTQSSGMYTVLNSGWTTTSEQVQYQLETVTQDTYTQDVSITSLSLCFDNAYNDKLSLLTQQQYNPSTMNYIAGLVDIAIYRNDSSLNAALQQWREQHPDIIDPYYGDDLYYHAPAYFVVQTSATGVSTTTVNAASFNVDIQILNRVWMPDGNLVLVVRTCIDQYTNPNDGSIDQIKLVDRSDTLGVLKPNTLPDFGLYTDSTSCDMSQVVGKCCQIWSYKSVAAESLTCFNTSRTLVWSTQDAQNVAAVNGQLATLQLALDVCKPPELQINGTLTDYTATLKTYTDVTLSTDGNTYMQGQDIYTSLAIDGLSTATEKNAITITPQYAQLCFAGNDWTDSDGNAASCSSPKSKKYTIYDLASGYTGGSRWQFQRSHNAFAGVTNSQFTTSYPSVDFAKFISNVMQAPNKYPTQLRVTWRAQLNAQQQQSSSLSKKSAVRRLSVGSNMKIARPVTSLLFSNNEQSVRRFLKLAMQNPKSQQQRSMLVSLGALAVDQHKQQLLPVNSEMIIQFVDASSLTPPGSVSVQRKDAVTLSDSFYPNSRSLITLSCANNQTFDPVLMGCINAGGGSGNSTQPEPEPGHDGISSSTVIWIVVGSCVVVSMFLLLGTHVAHHFVQKAVTQKAAVSRKLK